MAQKADRDKRDFDPRNVHVLDEHPDGGKDVHEFGVPAGRTKAADRPFITPKTNAERKYRRLFSKLRAMNLCQQGDPLRQSGVLFWSANYLRLVAIERDEQPDAETWRHALRRSSPASTLAEIDAAIERACTRAPIEHDAGQIGRDMDLRDNRWRAARHPRDILPCNRTGAQVAKFFRDHDASRKRRKRAADGARPQHLSNVKLAERHGRDRETIARWVADGIIDPVTGALTGKPQPKRGRKPSRNMPQKRPPPYKDTTLSVFEEVRTPDAIAACSAPAGFTEADLAHMAAAVDIGLQDAGNVVELPGRNAALARLMEIAAQAFAPRPAGERAGSSTIVLLPQGRTEPATNDRGECRAPVGSANETAGETGETFGKAERASPSAGQHSAGTDPNPPLLLQRCKNAAGINLEDIDTMQNDGADAPAGAEPIEAASRCNNADTTPEPAPQRAPVRSRRDWLVAIQKLNRALVELDLDDADRIALKEERAELVAGFRAAFPAQEQAQDGQGGSGPADRAGGENTGHGRATAPRPTRFHNAVKAADRPITYSAPSFRRARA